MNKQKVAIVFASFFVMIPALFFVVFRYWIEYLDSWIDEGLK